MKDSMRPLSAPEMDTEETTVLDSPLGKEIEDEVNAFITNAYKRHGIDIEAPDFSPTPEFYRLTQLMQFWLSAWGTRLNQTLGGSWKEYVESERYIWNMVKEEQRPSRERSRP